MKTKIGGGKSGPRIGPKEMLELTSTGFWAYVPQFATPVAFYSVNNVTVSTHRNFVEHTMPGRKGSVFQDMGRPAVKIVVEGNLNESGIASRLNTRSMLERLHKLCDEGKPLDFVCDMPALFGVSQVVIVDLEATEVRGRKDNYDYKLTLKEYPEDNTLKNDYLAHRQKYAVKDLILQKKTLIVGAAAATLAVAIPYAVSKNNTQSEPEKSLRASFRLAKYQAKADVALPIMVVVSDNRGTRVDGAKVDMSFSKDGAADQSLASGLSTDTDGLVNADFKQKDPGKYVLKAVAKKDGYTDGSASQVTIEVVP